MVTNQYTRNYHTTFQLSWLSDVGLYFDRDIPEDDISRTVLDVSERINIYDYIERPNPGGRRPDYTDEQMMRIILLASALGEYKTLREMDDLCKYDIRFMFVSGHATPCYKTIERFMNRLKVNIHDLFVTIVKVIEDDDDIGVAESILTIDGTKFEAYANKYTFIWRKGIKKYLTRLWVKACKLIEKTNKFFSKNGIDVRYSVLKQPDFTYLIAISSRLQEYMLHERIVPAEGRGHKKPEVQKLMEAYDDFAVRLFKYTIMFDMLDGRNSCSKTDVDASFLHMKYDYYCHNNTFKPGYNVQFAVCSGFIKEILINTDANDQHTYIPTIERFKADYGYYPSIVGADAGYCSYDNLKYSEDHGINLYTKYQGMTEEKKRVTKKNQYKTVHMKQPDGSYVCPEGHKFEKISEKVNKQGEYDRIMITLENKHCCECPNKSKCTKAKKNRKISVSPQLEAYHDEIIQKLETPVGKEIMNVRRIASEGTFGVIKEDYEYERLHRRGYSSVELEFTLVAIGHNLRKYNRLKAKARRKKMEQAFENFKAN